MTRQAFIRVLLSLLLLVSQQMASSHVMSHLGGTMGATALSQPVSDERLAAAFAHNDSCSHCLAFAQLAGPLGSTAPAFVLPESRARSVTAAAAHPAGARIILAFHSRAPPQA